MDKRFMYSFVVFLVFSGIPIGVIMLSIATYPDSSFTQYAAENFSGIVFSLFLMTVSLIGGVFYFFSNRRPNEVSGRSE